MPDNHHILDTVAQESTKIIAGVSIASLLAALVRMRKAIHNYFTRNRRRNEELVAQMQEAFENLTVAFNKNTAQLEKIGTGVVELGKIQKDISIEMRVFSTMAMIAFRESEVARWVTDKHGMCIEVNEKCIELFRLPRERMMGRGWTQRIRTNQIEGVSEAFDRAYRSNGHIHYKSTYTLDYDDGTCLTVIAEQSDIVRDGEGIYQMSGTIIPIYPPLKSVA